MELAEQTDMLIVAGGDGTLQEVVTGLLRRPDQVCLTHLLYCHQDLVLEINAKHVPIFPFIDVNNACLMTAGHHLSHTHWIHSTGHPQLPESESSPPQ